MATFFMFGSYSSEAIQKISSERTGEVVGAVEQFGGTVTSIHALLGSHDLVFIVDLPGVEKAMQASIALTKLTGISFTTSPAVTAEKFDELMS